MKEGLVIINVSLTVYNRFHRLLMSHNSTSKFGSETESLKGDVYIYIFYLITVAHESFEGELFPPRGRAKRTKASRGSLRISFLKSRREGRGPLSGRWATAIKSDVLR